MGFVALAVAIFAVAAAPAGAATIGSRHLGTEPDFGTGCDVVAEDCIWVQTKLPGARVRAPFRGKIRKWRVVTPGINEYQLVVMRKRPNGKFKPVGASLTQETSAGAGTYAFRTNIAVRKGDYVGLRGESFQGIDNSQARRARFGPPVPPFGTGVEPTFRTSGELLYNAIVKRKR